jgi:Putative threonine efflux protein
MISGPATAALTASALGLTAALTPGPLLALVLAQTLAHGPREGIKVAIAPLLTDAPIVLAALLLAGSAAGHSSILAGITLAGCLFLLWCAAGCLRWRPENAQAALATNPGSIKKGVLANLLNPGPYLFWMTVGAPLISRSYQFGWATLACFLGAFSLSIVGTKATVALLAGRYGSLLGSRGYVWIMRGLGAMLLVYAALFARDALAMLSGA